MSKSAVLILAAGNSSRMGVPKQLLQWKGTSLLQHTINTVKTVNLKTILVLGANYETITSKIDTNQITVLFNAHWKKGLGNSIAFGVNYIKKSLPDIENMVIMLADQPLIDSSFLIEMIHLHDLNPNKIISTLYPNGKLGVPVMFNASFFEDLLLLNGDNGAKGLLEKRSSDVIALNGLDLITDIDTIKDYERLYKRHH